MGLVSHMDAKTHRYFTAEDPQKLTGLATRREVAIQEAQIKLKEAVPALKELLGTSGHRPSVRYYDGESGVRAILEDVLETTGRAERKLYRIYSSQGLRDLIAHAWPGFIKKRIRSKVEVKTISIGKGGSTHGLDERKWLSETDAAPTYTFIYPGKVAFVSVDERNQLFGVMIDDKAIAATQVMIFDALWRIMYSRFVVRVFRKLNARINKLRRGGRCFMKLWRCSVGPETRGTAGVPREGASMRASLRR
jgi:hypothetical protein